MNVAPYNCPIIDYKTDGTVYGRCTAAINEGHCLYHGDVRAEIVVYQQTGMLTNEPDRKKP